MITNTILKIASVCNKYVHVIYLTFCRPGNLNFALRRASMQEALWLSLERMDMIT